MQIVSKQSRLLAGIVVLPLLFLLFGCGRAQPDRSGRDQFMSRAVTQHKDPVTVRAAVLTDDESERYLGVALADEGIQAVWMSVENASDALLYYLPVMTDPNYFTPPEAAQLFHSWRSAGANTAMDHLFAREAMPDIVQPRQTAAGFVLTHREGGLKFLNASFVESGQQFDFRFVLPLGGRTYAVQEVDFNSLYPPGSVDKSISRPFAPGCKPCLAAPSTRRVADQVIRSIL